MDMIASITEQSEWKDPQPPSTKGEFLQSWEYGEFLRTQGRDVKRWHLSETNEYVQAIVYTTAMGPYVYVPRVHLTKEGLAAFVAAMKKEGYMFVRIEPASELELVGYKTKTGQHLQQLHTWVLPLGDDTEQLLAKMHKKTRYNIRVAERKGVSITHEKNLDILLALQQETTNRNGFSGYSQKYCEALLALPGVDQFIAWIDDTPIATIVTLGFGDTLLYFIGSSTHEHKSLMAPYLAQWHVVQYAKQHGYAQYDFWGAAKPLDQDETNATVFHGFSYDQTDPLAGVTRFKAGFGGRAISFPGATDIILKPFAYQLYRWYRALRPVAITGHPQR